MNKILFSFSSLAFCVIVFLFFNFNSTVKKDLVWFNTSDQNSWVIYSALDFGDGENSPYNVHPGIGVSYAYSFGYQLLKFSGITDYGKATDLKGEKDPISKLPEVYRTGVKISQGIVLISALLFGCIIFFLTTNYLVSAFAFLSVLCSAGFLFHSVMLRAELVTVFYFTVSLFFAALATTKKNYYIISACLVLAGFFIGLAYFTKYQIIFLVLFSLILYVLLLLKSSRNWRFSSIVTRTSLFINTLLVSFFLLLSGLDITYFWILVYGLILISGIFPELSRKTAAFKKLVDISSILSFLGTGFLISKILILYHALGGDPKSMQRVLDFTSLFSSSGSSHIDTEVSRIMTRFLYYLKHYFLQSILSLTVLTLLFQLVKKKFKFELLLALVFLVILLFSNSIRVMLLINLGRSVFKYMIFSDVLVVMLMSGTYVYLIREIKQKQWVHLTFLLLLVLTSFNNFHKVNTDTRWNWTTYTDLVYPEQWLFAGKPPLIRTILTDAYKGYNNGTDRVVFGDEIQRGKGISIIPGGKAHLKMVHDRSMSIYKNRLSNLLPETKELIGSIDAAEDIIFDYKIELFEKGFSYSLIKQDVFLKRIETYKRLFDNELFTKFNKLVNQHRLTVPF